MMYEIRSYIGTRKVQEDAYGGCMTDNGMFVVVCDGIGGSAHGKESSQFTAERLTELFRTEYTGNFPHFILKAAESADTEINEKYGGRCGTTAVAVHICSGELNWFSVGDSRLYIMRNGRLKQITTDHNYGYVLELRKQKGLIDEDTFRREMNRAEHLASYIGMGGMDIVDLSLKPFLLEKGDKLLVTTDGLYKSLTEDIIYDIIYSENDIFSAADALRNAVMKCTAPTDNTTFALIYT